MQYFKIRSVNLPTLHAESGFNTLFVGWRATLFLCRSSFFEWSPKYVDIYTKKLSFLSFRQFSRIESDLFLTKTNQVILCSFEIALSANTGQLGTARSNIVLYLVQKWPLQPGVWRLVNVL